MGVAVKWSHPVRIEKMQFPTVIGKNLQHEKLSLPADLSANFNVLLLAFYHHQQASIDTWIPVMQELEREQPGIRYYELTLIHPMNLLSRAFIEEEMRAEIPDEGVRARTVTLYVNKTIFLAALGIEDEHEIQTLLVDDEGNVLWKTSGEYTPERLAGLIAQVKTARGVN